MDTSCNNRLLAFLPDLQPKLQGSENGGKIMKNEVPEIVDNIIRYEEGEMSWEEEVAFFQDLINSGMVWILQGHYGRTAKCYIDCGYCKPAKTSAKHTQ